MSESKQLVASIQAIDAAKWEQLSIEAVTLANNTTVTSLAEANDAAAKAKEFKNNGAALKIEVDTAIAPAKRLLQEFTDGAKVIMGRFDTAMQTLKNKALEWQRAEERRVEEENRKALEEQRKREEEERKRIAAQQKKEEKAAKKENREPAPPPPPTPVAAPVLQEAPKLTGASNRQTWDVEVIDKALLPEEFKIADMVALRKAVAGDTGRRQIPGARVFPKQGGALR